MKLFNVLLMCMSIAFSAAQDKGTIVGKITDKDKNNEPVYANILIKNTTKGTASDFEDGLYEIDNLDPGTYTLVVSSTGYETSEIPNVNVVAGKVTEVNVALGQGGVVLDEVVVTTVARRDSPIALLIEQKKAVEIKQSIAAQDLSRRGVSDVESGLTKVSGVTKVASRGIFIRGLDDRYNSLLINQLPASVVDWEQKIVPLDLFTVDIVRNIDINKIFYPHLYGDFAGATIDINTKDIPSEQVVSVNFSTGFNEYALQEAFLTDKESNNEYFGIGGADARAVPSTFDRSTIGTNISLTPSESAGLFESDFNFEERNAPVNYGFGVLVGDKFDTKGEAKLGYYIGLSYGNAYEFNLGSEEQYGVAGDFVRSSTLNNTFEYTTNSNLLISLIYQNPKTKLKFNYLQPRSTSNLFADTRGVNRDVDDRYARESRYKSSILHQLQFIGQTRFDEGNTTSLRYLVTYGLGKFNQPDQKLWSYQDILDDGSDELTTEFSNGQTLFFNRYFLSSDNSNIAGKLEFSKKFKEEEYGYKHELRIGADANIEEVDFFNRFLLIERFGNSDNFVVDPDSPNTVLEQGFAENRLRYAESTTPKNFVVTNDTYAGYVNYVHRFSEKFDLSAGVRTEYINRSYVLQNVGILDQFISEEIESGIKLLPSLNIKYSLNDKSNLRFAASKSYTRPKNVEIAPFLRINSVGDSQLGNETIILSDNYNADLKYEIFPNTGELISINTFAKYIDNPIETTLIPLGGTSFQTQFVNSDQAFLYGVEFEVIKKLGNIVNNEALNGISFGFNLTLMQSEVTIDRSDLLQAALTNDSRRLQGASDMLLNADISYAFDMTNTWKSTLTTTFSTFSERISQVSTGGLDDRFEQPFNDLGLVWRNEVNDYVSFSVKAANLLNDTSEQLIDVNATTQSFIRFKRGRTLSFSISYDF
ncbi:MAG: TonB-dependent receptor [Bacteroidota bacterium]